MSTNKSFSLFVELKRMLLQIALKLFGSTKKAWAMLANEYLASLRAVVESYIGTLDIKIYILSILAASNAEFQTTIKSLEECKQELQNLIKQCFTVDKQKAQSIKDLKRQIAKIHSEVKEGRSKMRAALQLYKKAVRGVRGVEYLLYFYGDNQCNPSVKLEIDNVNKTQHAPEQGNERTF